MRASRAFNMARTLEQANLLESSVYGEQFFSWQNFHTCIGCGATAAWRAPPIWTFGTACIFARICHIFQQYFSVILLAFAAQPAAATNVMLCRHESSTQINFSLYLCPFVTVFLAFWCYEFACLISVATSSNGVSLFWMKATPHFKSWINYKNSCHQLHLEVVNVSPSPCLPHHQQCSISQLQYITDTTASTSMSLSTLYDFPLKLFHLEEQTGMTIYKFIVFITAQQRRYKRRGPRWQSGRHSWTVRDVFI